MIYSDPKYRPCRFLHQNHLVTPHASDMTLIRVCHSSSQTLTSTMTTHCLSLMSLARSHTHPHTQMDWGACHKHTALMRSRGAGGWWCILLPRRSLPVGLENVPAHPDCLGRFILSLTSHTPHTHAHLARHVRVCVRVIVMVGLG